MSNYCLINKDTKTVEYYNSHALVYKYLMEGIFETSDIKEVGDISPLLDELRYRGILIYEVSKMDKPQSYTVETTVGASTLVFNSIFSAVSYCKEAKLSTAGDSYIKTALTKNLMGKTKSAYGHNWVFKTEALDLSEYQIKVII